jgi:predicted aminopeptidase
LKAYEDEKRLQRQIVAALLDTRERLKILYESGRRLPREELRARKAAEFVRLRDVAGRLRGAGGNRPRMKEPPASLLNNASLNNVAAYYTLLPGFERMLAAENGDLEAFLKRVEAMNHMSREARWQALERAAAPPPPAATDRRTDGRR